MISFLLFCNTFFLYLIYVIMGVFVIKNQKSIIKFEIFSIIFVSVLGVLLHFAFEWSNQNLVIGTFSAVNESTWEHLKLLFFPMLITTIIGYFFIGKRISSFLCARVFAIISSMLFTITFFYTYTGILGTNIAFVNIAIFFAAVVFGEYISYRLLISGSSCDNSKAIIAIGLLLFCFIFFTFFPPQIGLFKDPISGGYSIFNISR